MVFIVIGRVWVYKGWTYILFASEVIYSAPIICDSWKQKYNAQNDAYFC